MDSDHHGQRASWTETIMDRDHHGPVCTQAVPCILWQSYRAIKQLARYFPSLLFPAYTVTHTIRGWLKILSKPLCVQCRTAESISSRYFSCEPDRKRTPRWPSHRTIRLKVLIRLRTKWPSGSSVIPSLTSLTLWAPFQSSVINHTAVTLPEKLVPLTAIPMGKFIHELNEIQTYVYLCVCLMTYNY